MPTIFWPYFLTLVVILSANRAFALPENPALPQRAEEESVPTTTGKELDENNLMLKLPQEDQGQEEPKNFYYPYRQSLAVHLLVGGSTDQELRYLSGLGFAYQWPRFASPHAELGADVIGSVGGHLNFGVKHIYLERNYFRPYLIWGLTHEVIAEQRLATFTNIDNYYARASVGLEDVISLPKSVRIEAKLLASMKRQILLISFGYSWGW